MKDKLAALWAKIVENRSVVIKSGGAVAGAVVGLIIAAILSTTEEDVLAEPLWIDETPK